MRIIVSLWPHALFYVRELYFLNVCFIAVDEFVNWYLSERRRCPLISDVDDSRSVNVWFFTKVCT